MYPSLPRRGTRPADISGQARQGGLKSLARCERVHDEFVAPRGCLSAGKIHLDVACTSIGGVICRNLTGTRGFTVRYAVVTPRSPLMLHVLAVRAGIEPAAVALTARRSTVELPDK